METNEDGTTYFHRGLDKDHLEWVSPHHSRCSNMVREFPFYDEDVDISGLTIMIIIYAVI